MQLWGRLLFLVLALPLACSPSTRPRVTCSGVPLSAPPPPILARTYGCRDFAFEGPSSFTKCADVCLNQWTGRVGGSGLGPKGEKFTRLLTTAWLTQPAKINTYSSGRTLDTACQSPGPRQAFYCALDDSINWDYELLSLFDGFVGEFAAGVVLAHEWGHVNQQRAGMLDDDTNTPLSIELHADCQAGAFAAILQAWGELRADEVADAFFALCQNADPEGFFNPDGHGDCNIRTDAFLYGYKNGRLKLDQLCGEHPADFVVSMCTY